MLFTPHLILLVIALIFAVLSLIPSWPQVLLSVAVILAIIAQFVPR